MFNRWAILYFSVFAVLYTGVLLAVLKVHELLPSALLQALAVPRNLALLFSLASLFLFLGTQQLRTRPKLYIPSGFYRILSGRSNEKSVLLTVQRISGPKAALHPNTKIQEKIEAVVKRFLSRRTWLFCVPVEWFQVNKGLNYTEEDFLLCMRVKTHAMIFVSSDFYATHCARKGTPANPAPASTYVAHVE